MFKVFIAEKILRDIILEESRRPVNAKSNLFKILKSAKNLYVAMDAPDTEWIKQLKKEYDLVADTTRTAYIKKIPANPENVLKNPSSLYILNIPYADALAIQRNYGVMCVSGDSPNISPLIDVNDIHIAKEEQQLGRGWDTVLGSVEMLPSNALLMTDRYLFAIKYPSAANGISNIKDILTELLPKQFQGGNYHVTIVFDNMAKNENYSFSEIVQLIEDVKKQIGREYPITMEVLGITPECSIYKKLHNRMVISNYFLVEASHKLAAFNKYKGTVRQMLIPMTLFTESSLNGRSTPPLDAIDHTLATLRNFSKSLQYLPESSHKTYLYAVNGEVKDKCLSLRNRLVK